GAGAQGGGPEAGAAGAGRYRHGHERVVVLQEEGGETRERELVGERRQREEEDLGARPPHRGARTASADHSTAPSVAADAAPARLAARSTGSSASAGSSA